MSGGAGPVAVTRRLGRRGPEVTRLGLGCAPIGNLFTAVSEDDARAAVDAAWDAGIRYFDTAPLYGHGLSERRLGQAIADRPRDDIVLSTKVGRLLRAPVAPARDAGAAADTIFADVGPLEPQFDFSRDGILRSIDESLERLATDRIDVALVHDPDDHEQQALDEALPALLSLRDQGVVAAVGCGMNQAAMLHRMVQRVDLDCVLLAGRYSLLDHSGGDQLLPLCLERGVGVVLGGVFNSGVLVDPDHRPTYEYEVAPSEIVDRAQLLRAVCAEHGVTLAAAALQFALAHPAVTSVVVGARSAAEVATDVGWAATPVPDELWSALAAV